MIPRVSCVIEGEEILPARRGDKTVTAVTEGRLYCRDAVILDRLIDAVRRRRADLLAQPKLAKKFDYQSCYAHPRWGNPDGAATLVTRVAWYDPDLYRQRRDTILGIPGEGDLLSRIGLDASHVQVCHWRPDPTF